MPEALPAVTVPFLSKAGRRLASASSVAPCLGYSSVSTTTSPLRDSTLTATSSSLNRPAASQRDWRNKAIAAPRDIDNEPISITSVTQRAAQCRNMDGQVGRLDE